MDYDLSRTEGHLRTLSICHYVYAALALCGTCLGGLYIGIGGLASTAIKEQAAKTGQTGGPPAEMFGWIFGAIGVVIILVTLTVAVLCFLTARALAERRSRTFSLITAGVCCVTGLLGVALGVFTFVVLLSAEAKRLYEGERPPA